MDSNERPKIGFRRPKCMLSLKFILGFASKSVRMLEPDLKIQSAHPRDCPCKLIFRTMVPFDSWWQFWTNLSPVNSEHIVSIADFIILIL